MLSLITGTVKYPINHKHVQHIVFSNDHRDLSLCSKEVVTIYFYNTQITRKVIIIKIFMQILFLIQQSVLPKLKHLSLLKSASAEA